MGGGYWLLVGSVPACATSTTGEGHKCSIAPASVPDVASNDHINAGVMMEWLPRVANRVDYLGISELGLSGKEESTQP